MISEKERKRSSIKIFAFCNGEVHLINFLSFIVSGIALGKVSNFTIEVGHETIFDINVEVFFTDLIDGLFHFEHLGFGGKDQFELFQFLDEDLLHLECHFHFG